MKKQKTMTIDLEPTWEGLCHLVVKGNLPADELIPACKLADIVRQAQKQGKAKVTFSFENGKVHVQTL